MFMIYCQTRKKKKTLSLEADMITIKINIYLVSAAQKLYFYSTCCKCVHWWHTCSLQKLSITLTHSAPLGYGHFYCGNRLRNVFIHVILQELPEIRIQGFQIGWMRKPLRFAASADQPIRESMSEPLHCDVSCMWSCPILLEPLRILIHATTCSQSPPELL